MPTQYIQGIYKHTLESDSSASPEPPVGSVWDRIRGEGSDTLADVILGGSKMLADSFRGIDSASGSVPGGPV